MLSITTPEFWIALFQIIVVDIVLSGDNAVVIALACRCLSPQHQKKAIIFGSMGAIALRITLTFFAVYLLSLPFLKIVGSLLLMWIAIKLLIEEEDGDECPAHENLLAAIKTIIVADFIMSLDNVVGVAAAAKGSVELLIIGLAISMPLIIFGSTIIMKIMARFPIIITAGAALLGWVAGEMFVGDPILKDWISNYHFLHITIPAVAAAAVVLIGKQLSGETIPTGC